MHLSAPATRICGVLFVFLRDHVRAVSKPVFHPSGACTTGRTGDPVAVIGEDLKVRGVDGLRIADASVRPTLAPGNANAPVLVIGERAARFMLGKALAC
jgi:choline dehydrogenase